MLRFLFPGLTPAPQRGDRLFAAVTAIAREPHWYLEGDVPDSVDGRFRVLATVAALALVRLEQADPGNAGSVALTERFIEVMESEHRQMGLGDPGLGRTVRRLVGALSRRVGLWRVSIAGEADWAEAVRSSLYRDAAAPDAVDHSAQALRMLWRRLERVGAPDLMEGRLG